MRVALAVSSVLLSGLAVGAPSAGSDTAPPTPSGHWGGVGGLRYSFADRRHAWRFVGPQQGFWRRIEATDDGGKHWRTVFRVRRRTDGIIAMNRLSPRVGVAVALVGPRQLTYLTVDNGRHWRTVQGGRRWFLFEGDARALYLTLWRPGGYSKRLYRLARWRSTGPNYVHVFDAPELIVSLRKAPNGIVALLKGRRYNYSVAIHRHGRTHVVAVPTTGLDANPHTCEAFRFTVRWPVLSLVTESGQACEQYEVEHVSRDGGQTWEMIDDPDRE